MNKRIILSNVGQILNAAIKTPAILNVGGLSAFRPLVNTGGGGCGRCGKAAAKIAEARPQFEATMSVLVPSEQQRLKTLLDTEELCYYSKQPNGQLKLNCF